MLATRTNGREPDIRLAESECMKMARLTGERPMAGATPDSLLAFHDAGYREMRERLGPGAVLDVAGGVGDQTARLAGLGRLVIGVDYDAQTAVDAAREWAPEGLRFAAM